MFTQPHLHRHKYQIKVAGKIGHHHVKHVHLFKRQRARQSGIGMAVVGKQAQHIGVISELRHGVNQRFAQAFVLLHRVHPDSV